MKKVLILAAAALALAACAKQQEIPVEETQPMAVGFDAYLNRGVTKSPTTAASLATDGFGIFAYYTDNDNYDGTSIPNFMYNQEVTNTGGWTYSPVKYWPNEYGDKAVAEESDRISFFAYGPYALDNGSGKAGTMPASEFVANSKNIIGFTKNNYAGDPLVKYVVDLNPATSVDLVWGRQPANNTFEAYDGTTYDDEGLPWLNVRRPQYSADNKEKVKFQFDHALASLNVQVDHYADNPSYADNNVDANTRIWIRSVTFTGFATEGALNLNNLKANGTDGLKLGVALWESLSGEDLITGDEVTIFDGRKDGKEGTSAASNEKYTGLNPNLVQSAPYTTAAVGGTDIGGKAFDAGAWLAYDNTNYYSGVLNAPQNLFVPSGADADEKLAAPVYVIPTGDPVTVTIAYDVETKDDKLATFLSDNATKGSSISNVITKDVTFSPALTNGLENGKKYTIKLHLGMNSVKVDAIVTGWKNGAEGEADLPDNAD